MTTPTQKLADEFNRYFTSANGVDVPERVSVSRDEWRALYAAITKDVKPRPHTKSHTWPGPGPEPHKWTAADGTLVYRDYESYCMD